MTVVIPSSHVMAPCLPKYDLESSQPSTIFDSSAPMTHAERVYHSVASSPYCLPSDEAERQRLIRQHFALKKIAGHGELLASPLEIPEDAFVLDSGTGSGAYSHLIYAST